ncbi:MAG: chemotaxis response regulator protein-glutamate methylesterase [Candidatus Sumerlaeia bacterium]
MASENNGKTRILIVDDSVVVRGALTRLLGKYEDIEVVGSAGDPYEAREMLVSLKPDVMTLDIEMPKMDGLTFLQKIMQHFPIPVVMLSSLTREGADLSMKAIDLGAVDVINKPSSTQADGLRELGITLADKIRAAAKARVRRKAPPPNAKYDPRGRPLGLSQPLGRVRGTGYAKGEIITPPPELKRNLHKVIAIGASTGGTEALRVVLERLPKECPPIVIVQHMPEYFTLAFANRMNSFCEIDVKEAEDGDRLRPGLAVIAPGNSHLILRNLNGAFAVRVQDGPLVCRHRPSVEVLFQSVARAAGPNAVGVMLTGMGGDGATGMLCMKQKGALNIAQDEASSVVFGMPKEAIKAGGVDKVQHLERIAETIIEFCCKR